MWSSQSEVKARMQSANTPGSSAESDAKAVFSRVRGPIDLALIGLMALMTGSWIYAWSLGFGAPLGGGSAIGLPFVLVILLIGIALARSLPAGQMSLLGRLGLALFGLFGAMLVGALSLPSFLGGGEAFNEFSRTAFGPRAVVAAFIALFCLWRGIAVGRARLTFSYVEFQFRLSFLFFLLLLIFVILAGGGHSPSAQAMLPAALLVVGSGLIALPLARIGEVNEEARYRNGPPIRTSGPWLTILLSVVSGLLLLSFVLAAILGSADFSAIYRPLGEIIFAILLILLLPMAYLAGLIVKAIGQLTWNGPEGFNPNPVGEEWINEVRRTLESQQVSPTFILILEILTVVGLVAIIVFFFARMLTRIEVEEQRRNDEPEELRDFVWQWPGWRAALAWLIALIFRRAPKPTEDEEAANRPAVVSAGDLDTRAIYRDFLRLGADIGHARKKTETPLEYERRLNLEPLDADPDSGQPEPGSGRSELPGAPELHSLTESYTRARYGPARHMPALPEIRSLQSALERLRALWRNRFGEG